jgi:hypothetical protein
MEIKSAERQLIIDLSRVPPQSMRLNRFSIKLSDQLGASKNYILNLEFFTDYWQSKAKVENTGELDFT